MRIPVVCGECGFTVEVDEANAGKKYTCSKCGNKGVVPHPSTTEPPAIHEPVKSPLSSRKLLTSTAISVRASNVFILMVNLLCAFAIPSEPAVAAGIMIFFNSWLLFRCVQLFATHVEHHALTDVPENLTADKKESAPKDRFF